MTRSELQQALKALRVKGLTNIKLTVKTDELQEEFDRIGSCSVNFSPISESGETIHPEAAEIVEPVKEALMSRVDGAQDEVRMQDLIDRAGLWEELKAAWYSIPGYKHFEMIFNGDPAAGMFAELMMTETEHRLYVKVCREAQWIEEEFARKALEKIVSQ